MKRQHTLTRKAESARARCINAQGFTLAEVLVSMGILAILMAVTLSMVNMTTKLVRNTSGKISAFKESRAAFDSLTRRVSQSTLNTYYDYVDSSGKSRKEVEDSGGVFVPDKYVRQSELHFVTGQANTLIPAAAGKIRPSHAIFFQAMLGFSSLPCSGDAQLSNLLNAVGYFVEYGSDADFRPGFLDGITPARNRYRLMQMVQNTETLRIYSQALTAGNRFEWFTKPLEATPSQARPVAENIVAAVFWARRAKEDSDGKAPLTANYTYDTKSYLSGGNAVSRNQLPPVVEVLLVAIDEPSAMRLEAKYAGTAPLLQPGALFATAPDPGGGGSSPLSDDLKKLTDFLTAESLNFRVFTTSIQIRQSKFSAD
ncbi:hypothetical protein DB346_06795 [Verrucomicrobia bacterium LW23]|nr:hypothetical protein DB346_06795 [Verrucomicrobia bacterium LW23]